MALLTPGSVAKVITDGAVENGSPAVFQVKELQEANGKMKCSFTDGKENVAGALTSQVARQFGSVLKANDYVRITEATINNIPEKGTMLIVNSMEVIASDEATLDLDTKSPTPAPAADTTEAPKEEAPAAAGDVDMKEAEEEDKTAVAAVDAKTPAAGLKSAAINNNANGVTPRTGPTPPSGPYGAPPAAPATATAAAANTNSTGKNRTVIPIASLNPYNHGWAIRAKVVSKSSKRSFAKGSLFNVELIDAAGTAIEGTFWRDAAERCYDSVEEGKVYVFARGSVKPANKKFSQVRNDYCLHFDSGVEITPCDDVEIDATAVKLSFVPIDQLIAFVDKKTLVDVIGVVTTVAPLGSVKRKVDSVDLPRRDVTIVDQACRTVIVTLWGNTAQSIGQELEDTFNAAQSTGAAVTAAISSCRVSSYNGVSVSTLGRSQIFINGADIPEATALSSWWEESGSTATLTAIGEGMATAIKPNANGQRSQDRMMITEFKESAPASAADKPVYATVFASFASINPERTMWYEACAENNRKVVSNGDGTWLCEYDGKSYPTMTRRYIINTPVMDATGDAYLQVFNDQAEVLLGRSADDLAALKNNDDTGAAFNAALRGVAWSEWVLRLKAQAQEYQGETRVRYAVADIKPVDYIGESRRILEVLAA